MRHDFAEVVHLVCDPPEDLHVIAGALASGAVPTVKTLDDREFLLTPAFSGLFAATVEELVQDHCVVVLAADEVLSLSEAASEMKQEPWLIEYWIRGGLLEDYSVGDDHHVSMRSIRHFEKRHELATTVGLDLSSGPILGWDDESCQRAWTKAVAVLGPLARAPESLQAFGALVGGQAALLLRSERDPDVPVGKWMAELLLQAAEALAAGRTVVLASVDELVDPLTVAQQIGVSLGRVIRLIDDGMLDEYRLGEPLPMGQDRHIPLASALAWYRHRRGIAQKARATLEARGVFGDDGAS